MLLNNCTPRAIPLDYILVTRACPHLLQRSMLRNSPKSLYRDQIFMHCRSIEEGCRGYFRDPSFFLNFLREMWLLLFYPRELWFVYCRAPWFHKYFLRDLWKRPHFSRANDEEFRKCHYTVKWEMLVAIIFGGFENITIWLRFNLAISLKESGWGPYFFQLVTTNFGEIYYFAK